MAKSRNQKPEIEETQPEIDQASDDSKIENQSEATDAGQEQEDDSDEKTDSVEKEEDTAISSLPPLQKDQVHIKFLKFVGQYKPGDIVAVHKDAADVLCAFTAISNGDKHSHHRKAILLKEANEISNAPIDIKKMTAADMAALGKKNIVQTPIDTAYEKMYEKLKDGGEIDKEKLAKLSNKAKDKADAVEPEWVKNGKPLVAGKK